MKKQLQNPPAFPQLTAQPSGEEYKGMTLRDYFAAAALHGVINNQMYGMLDEYEMRSAMAFRYADAMLKAREYND